MDTLKLSIRKNGITHGLILGLVTVLLSIVSYYIVTAKSVSVMAFIVAPIILRVFIPMAVVLYLCFSIRKRVGGLWTFKQATTGIFIMLITAYAVNLLGNDLLFDKVIEPQGVQKTQIAAIKVRTENMKSNGESAAKIDSAVTAMKDDLAKKDNSTVGSFIMGNAFIILFLFVFSVIFASLIRNAVLVSAEEKK